MNTEALTDQGGVRIAVEGCGHGTLNAIYAGVERASRERGWGGAVDLVVICGDFQAVRNAADLNVMSVPEKYRALGDYHEYYAGTRVAPYLTVFIGGNHEASSHLRELFHGGWVAPNIYYLGAASVVRLGPLRIASMSGIFKGHDYNRPHTERLPFDARDVKSIYHVREIDVRRLLLLRSQVDVGISHDWPRAIERHGDDGQLFRCKPFFKKESLDGTLGSAAATYVMDRLRPAYWFSAHMHCKFSAVRRYADGEGRGAVPEVANEPAAAVGASASKTEPAENPDEIDLDMDDADDDQGGAEIQDAKPVDVQQEETPAPDQTEEEAKPEQHASVISDDLRALLPASFRQPPPSTEAPEPRPVPATRARGPPPGQPVPPGITNQTVRFLALDKCLPGRGFLQLCEILPLDPSQAAAYPPLSSSAALPTTTAATSTSNIYAPRYKLEYDPEWLAITRALSKDLAVGLGDPLVSRVPADMGEAHYAPLVDAERAWVDEHVVAKGKLQIPENFAHTAPPHVPGQPEAVPGQPDEYTNPQTAAFCELIGVENLWDASEEERMERKANALPERSWVSHGGGGRGGGGWGRGRGGGGRGGGRGGRGGRGGGGRGRGGRGRWH